MTTRKVSVERYVEQVRDGSHYKGYVKIADTRFDYDLVFTVPIDQLDSMEPAKGENDICRRLFQITVKRASADIELIGEEEYGFFLSMVLEFAVQFYNNSQTRASNEGHFGQVLQGKGDLAEFGVRASIGMTERGLFNFQQELCDMLNTPKFSCALAA